MESEICISLYILQSIVLRGNTLCVKLCTLLMKNEIQIQIIEIDATIRVVPMLPLQCYFSENVRLNASPRARNKG